MQKSNNSDGAPKRYGAIVVGAGFSGIYMLHKLRQMGISVRCFELASDVGGVWYFNRYPGAHCDVPSQEYSYSFSADLENEWRWSKIYAPQPEILAYLKHVADRFNLREDISFETRVESAIFDETTGLWEVKTNRGDHVVAPFCIMASGPLSVKRLPDIPGIETYQGEIIHTGDWPHHDVDFSGRRVGIIGTGSTGIQAIPMIAKTAKELVVFQRTPNFVVPSRNGPLSDEADRNWKNNRKELRARARAIGTLCEHATKGAMDVTAEEREKEYNSRWEIGGVTFIHAYNNIATNQAANDTAADFVRSRIREVVNDPVVAERLCPKDHPLGTKRICIGSDYYETYNRENVTLVDLRSTPIKEVTKDAVVTSDATYPIDILICATGYDAMTGALQAIDIRGRNGLALKDKWKAGPRTYLGLMTVDFPNMFIVAGPGSPSVLANMAVGIEQHIEWIADCITHMRDRNASLIEPTRTAEDDWVVHVNDEANKTLFPKANSWYVGANIPGKPRVFLPYVGGIGRYRIKCDEVVAAGYNGFSFQ